MDKNINKVHLQYIKEKGKFTVDCPREILSDRKRELLETYGYFFEALTNGTLLPLDAAEEQFIEAVRKGIPQNECQEAWIWYTKRKKLENRYSALKKQPKLEQDPFYNRDGAKAVHNTLHNVWKENSKRI